MKLMLHCSSKSDISFACIIRCLHRTNFNLSVAIQLSRFHGTQRAHSHRDFLNLKPDNCYNYSKPPHVQVLRNQSIPYNQTCQHSFGKGLYSYHCSPKLSISDSYSVLHCSGFQHWFKSWQELRTNKLTASTFGGAIGFWPRRRVQLWYEKVGLVKPFTGNLATCWSNMKEGDALERYKLITGYGVCFPQFQVYNKSNTEDDWLGASPDGIVYGLPSLGVLEVKCPFYDEQMGRALPWKRIPLHCMPQAQGLMEILDRDWMHFYVWTPNGSSLFKLERDHDYWELLKSALSDFWWKHVQLAKKELAEEELCRLNPRTDPDQGPFTIIKHLKPAPKHELCSTIVKASKCLVDHSQLLWREVHGILQN